MDVIASEAMIIDTGRDAVVLPHCHNVILPIACKRRGSPKRFPARDVRAAARTVVPPRTITAVPVCFGTPLPTAVGDFEFTSTLTNRHVRGYHHVTDSSLHAVLVRNDATEPYVVDAFSKLGHLDELNCVGAYAVDVADYGLAALRPLDTTVDLALERVHPSGVTIYGDDTAYAQIAAIVEDYPELFTDRAATVDVPPTDHMPIPFRQD